MYGVIDKSATPAEQFPLLPVVLLELAAASEALPLLLRLQQRHEATRRATHTKGREELRTKKLTETPHNPKSIITRKTRKSKEEIQKIKKSCDPATLV